MRIAILTQPLHNNYGGLLQNFALQTILKQLGHVPVTIDIPYTQPQWPLHIRLVKYVWRLIKKACGDRSVLYCDLKRQWEFMNNPGREQKLFIDSFIGIIRVKGGLDREFVNNNEFDAYIVGSDQVWRPRFSPCFHNFFLDFTEGIEVKRIAYAASFGTDKWEGEPYLTPQIAAQIQRFDAVSVREKSGIALCRSVFGTEAQWVLDPTFLLYKEVYDKLLYSCERPIKKSYLAIYALDVNSTIDALIKTICKERNLIPLYIGQRSKKGFPSVESWLNGIFCSNYVLTDSFHGTVFSIIAHKPFITVVNSGRGASRFESILGALGLMERLSLDGNSLMLNNTIDYESVDKKLSIYREDSMLFLKNALNGK